MIRPVSPSTRRLVAVGTALAGRIDAKNARAIAFALLVLLALGDHVTGADVTFTFLYLLPIWIATWFRGSKDGMAIGALAIASRAGLTVASGQLRVHAATFAWNAIAEFVIFYVVVGLVDALRARIDVERHEKRLAVDQLRHAERLTTIGKLASGVAHELGTPLNVIMGRAELLLEGTPSAEGARESARVILRQGERMTAIVHQLLHFARRSGVKRAEVDLRTVARQSVDLIRPLAKKRNVALELDEAVEPMIVAVNASEMEQVLGNLIVNALQASRDGSVVRVVTERDTTSGTPSVSVVDEGTGMSPETLEHIFDPFFTTKDVGEGSGLGLSVSYGIVRDHGGRIDVTSREGEGSRFRVVFA
ncbi:MAG: ATP-binding protein [Polyangiaceae bacterium]